MFVQFLGDNIARTHKKPRDELLGCLWVVYKETIPLFHHYHRFPSRDRFCEDGTR